MISKVGIQTFTIRKQIKTLEGLESTLKFYSEQGIKNYELSRLNFSMEEMHVLKKLKFELGLTYTASQITLNKIIKDFDFLMDFSNALSIKYIEVSVIPLMSFIKKKKGIIKLSETLNKLGTRTKEHGVKLLFHHHNFELIKYDGELSFDILMDNTNKELVNFVCDSYWLARSGYNPAGFISERRDRVKGVHLRDNQFFCQLGKFKSSDTVIGEGTIDFKSIIEADRENKIDFYSIEQDTAIPQNDIIKSYNYLKNLK